MSNTPKKPICFVISPIGSSGTDTRKRSDQVLKFVFEEALGEQYAVTRADKISEPGIITSQIIRALQDSELVLADLTEHNANVFYELAVRHAAKKPVIHVIDSHWKIPFDVAPLRTIMFDYTDLASVAEAKDKLREQATEIQAGKWGETPIDIANVTRPSKQDSETTVLLKEAVGGIAALRSEILRLTDEHAAIESRNMTILQSQIDYLTNILTPASSLSPSFLDAAAAGMLSADDGSASAPETYQAAVENFKRRASTRMRPLSDLAGSIRLSGRNRAQHTNDTEEKK